MKREPLLVILAAISVNALVQTVAMTLLDFHFNGWNGFAMLMVVAAGYSLMGAVVHAAGKGELA